MGGGRVSAHHRSAPASFKMRAVPAGGDATERSPCNNSRCGAGALQTNLRSVPSEGSPFHGRHIPGGRVCLLGVLRRAIKLPWGCSDTQPGPAWSGLDGAVLSGATHGNGVSGLQCCSKMVQLGAG
jgi:hypothetical protein